MKRLLATTLSLSLLLSGVVSGAGSKTYPNNAWGAAQAAADAASKGQTKDEPPKEEVEEEEEKPVVFSDFTDVGDHWAKDYLEWAVNNGLIAGTGPKTLDPNGSITRAQMATVISNAFGAKRQADISMLVDVNKEDWFYEYIAKATQMGALSLYGNSVNPNEPVTRQEIAVALVKACGYPLPSDQRALSNFKDLSTVDEWARPYMAAAVTNGVVSGYTDGRIGAKDLVSRAQYVAMMKNVAAAYMTPQMVYQNKKVEGSLMVGMGNISLDNMEITGNLFLADGINGQPITLNGTNVKGVIYVRGTGASGVRLINGSKANRVVVCNPNTATAVSCDDTSSVGSTVLLHTTGTTVLSGNIGDLSVEASSASVRLNGAYAGSVSVHSRLASVQLDKSSSAGVVSVDANAIGATMDIQCPTSGITVGASNVKLSVGESTKYIHLDQGTDLTLGQKAVVGSMVCRGDSHNLTVNNSVGTLELDGNSMRVTVGSSAVIDKLHINGNNTTVTLSSGSRVTNIYTTGNSVVVSGSGKVNGIEVSSGKDVELSVPGAGVTNTNGENVFIGDQLLNKGDKVTINDSGNNTVENEKKPEEDKKPEEQKKPEVTPKLSFFVASNGWPSELGDKAFSEFGTNLAYDKTLRNLSGSVSYMKDFKMYDGIASNKRYATGYYVPLVIDSDINCPDGTLTINGARFDKSVVSQSLGYRGKWVAFIALDPNATSKFVTITWAPTSDKVDYKPVSAIINYSNVVFVGGTQETAIYDGVTATPGVNGGETAVVTKTSVDQDGTINFEMKTNNLLETRNNNGRFGYWTGVKIPAFSDAFSCDYTIKNPDNTERSGTTYVQSSGGGAQHISITFDGAIKKAGTGKLRITLKWKNVAGDTTAHEQRTLAFDLSKLNLAGETPNELPTVVSNVSIGAVSAELAKAHVVNYGVVDGFLRGDVFSVPGNEVLEAGYYFPVKVTGTAAAETTVAIDGGSSVTVPEGEFDETLFLPVMPSGYGVQDVKLNFIPVSSTAHSSYSVKLDCSGVMIVDSAIYVFPGVPEGCESLIVDGNYSSFGTTLDLRGTVKKQSDPSAVGMDCTDCWVVPVKVRLQTNLSNYSVRVSTPDKVYYSYEPSSFSGGEGVVFIPIAVDDEMVIGPISIELYDETVEETPVPVYTISVFNGGLQLEEFPTAPAS